MELRAAQVEEAVLEPRFLGVIVFGEDGHRQRFATPRQLDALDLELDFAGDKFGLTVPSGRGRTVPGTLMTDSLGRWAITSWKSESVRR